MGLARSYGFKTAPPGLTSSRIEVDKASAIRGRSETRENRSLGRQRGAIECACTNAIGFQFLCCRWKDSRHARHLRTRLRVFSPVAKPAASITRSSPVETNGSHAKEKIPLGNIDINTATEKELTTVPGIGHVMAARIIAARPFRSADDLKRVSGIGEKKYVANPAVFSVISLNY